MSHPFAKRALPRLAAVFLAAAGIAAPPAMAVAGGSRPVMPPPKTLKAGFDAPPPLSCVRDAGNASAGKRGFAGAQAFRRISALAEARQQQGMDTAPVAAMALASYTVGVDFDLLMMKAMIESHVGKYEQPLLGGSARGLFHYMPATWLTLFSWFGAEYNGGIYARAAAQIKFDAQNEPGIDDPALKEKILALRLDPYVAAFIKAKEVREDERPLLRAVLRREPTYTDFYIAHFLGLERAKTFFRVLRKHPNSKAADIFARESEDPNNRPLFYSRNREISVRQVYKNLKRVVGAKLRQIDAIVAAEQAEHHCVRPLVLQFPPATGLLADTQHAAPAAPGADIKKEGAALPAPPISSL